MDKKKLEGFKKRLETRQQELRHTVSRTEQDGRSADEDATQDIADKAANSYRDVQYRDIVILMRSPSGKVNDYVRILRLMGGPVSSQGSPP